MKYKLLKLLEPEYKSISVGSIFVPIGEFVSMDNGLKLPAELLIDQGFIEEVKEAPKPKLKVGDKVVREYPYNFPPDYVQIFSVGKSGINSTSWTYNNNSDFDEESLRSPTPEELSTYFR